MVMGPGENAGAVSLGGGLACAFKVESHNHPSAVEPFQGAATGVGGILRDVFAVGARPIAILDSLRFGEVERSAALALPARAGGRRHRPLRQLDRRRHRRRRDLLRGRLRAELPRQRDVPRADPGGRPDPLGGRGRRQRRAAVRRAHGPRRHRRRVGARLGGARRARRRQAPDGPDRRPVRGEEAARVLARAARARAARRAAGPRRRRPDVVDRRDGLQGRGRDRPRRPQGAAARGRHGGVRDHDLGVPGADAVRRRARRASTRSSRCARSGSSTRPRSARSPTRGGCACSTATRWSATCRSPRWSTSARSTTSSRSPRACRCTRRRAGPDRRRSSPATRCSRCWAAPTSPRAAGRSSSTTASSARAPCAGPRQADAAVLAAAGRLRDRGLDRRQRPPRRLRPLPRRGRGRARVLAPTSPASAPSRSG